MPILSRFWHIHKKFILLSYGKRIIYNKYGTKKPVKMKPKGIQKGIIYSRENILITYNKRIQLSYIEDTCAEGGMKYAEISIRYR